MTKSDQLLRDLFQAYYGARKNKRNTINALKFELNYESKLFELYRQIKNRNYEPSRSICFIVNHPIKREIFAADFRDRVVHHLLYNYLRPIFERRFLSDSYACRVGRGTHYGIWRLNHFIRSCSENYQKDCYILKLDIRGYFMSIDRNILFQKVEKILYDCQKVGGGALIADFNFDLVFYLLKKIIFNDSTKNCVVKSGRKDWAGLPKSKSLFYAGKNKGLPIGNLTSQFFGNVYLDGFDHFVKYKLGCRHYGRYVDDFVIVHKDKEYLKSIIPKIAKYLQENLGLELHDKKIYLQHYSRGVDFLGAIIKPYRIYVRNRIKGNFYEKIEWWNDQLTKARLIDHLEARLPNIEVGLPNKFLSSMNSYLGMMVHYKTYKLRRKMLSKTLSADFQNHVKIKEEYSYLKIRCPSERSVRCAKD